jgi:hypothetical protein
MLQISKKDSEFIDVYENLSLLDTRKLFFLQTVRVGDNLCFGVDI